jgi:hypothetical protein
MFLVIKIRLKLSALYVSLGIPQMPQKGSGQFSSIVYHEGLSQCLPAIKTMKLNSDHGAYYAIYTMLVISKARVITGANSDLDVIREQYKLENMTAPNNNYEMDALQNELISKYNGLPPWTPKL